MQRRTLLKLGLAGFGPAAMARRSDRIESHLGMGWPTNAKQSTLPTMITADLHRGATLLVRTRAEQLLIDGRAVRGVQCVPVPLHGALPVRRRGDRRDAGPRTCTAFHELGRSQGGDRIARDGTLQVPYRRGPPNGRMRDGRHCRLENPSTYDGSVFPTGNGTHPQTAIHAVMAQLAPKLVRELAGRDVVLGRADVRERTITVTATWSGSGI